MAKVPTRVHADKVTEIVLGQGSVVVGHTTDYKGSYPALTFSPAPEPGTPGVDFTPEGLYELQEDSVVLVFSTKASLLAHLDRLKMLMDQMVEEGSSR